MNKKKILLLILITLFLIAGINLFSFRVRNKSDVDVVALNDIAQSVAGQWNTLGKAELPCQSYGLDYVVLDHNNKVIAATRRGLNETISSALQNRDAIVDIKAEHNTLGKLIVYNDAKDIWRRYREKLLIQTLCILCVVALLAAFYVMYLDRKMILPFRKLQSFAKHVAEGKLDLPLEMDRSNLFGAFTESFDLMREELNKARESERIANQSKKELVASLSHDIKTPVASIKAVSEIVYAKSQDEFVKNQLLVINSKADQINTLITNMFSATLEELQELKVAPTEHPSNILYDLIRKADYNNKVTITKIPECILLVDELRLAQVIDNVVSNSYKYAGTSIQVTTLTRGRYLEIAFKDFGPGVSEEEKLLIFNKFYRAKNAEGKSGTGLGLYISKYLIHKMNGDISCETTEDGFCLRIRLLLA